ncbi:MAG: acyltransferase [Holophaga sp.]|nr:acyltransferase [Holophaga sp.]
MSEVVKGRLHSLDILRGLMALSVAVYHLSILTNLSEAGSRTNNLIAIFGNYGVEGFFIVSGFCFFYLYNDTTWTLGELRRFHLKRFFRIAPLYYLAVGLNLALHLHVGPQVTPRMLAENATLTFGLFHPNHALVLGGWSIGIEYVFYMAFPLLAFFTRRKILLVLLTLAFVALAWPWTFGAVQAASFEGNQKFHTYVQIPNHAFLFLLGGMVAWWRSLTTWRLRWPWFVGALVVVFLVALPRGPVSYDHFDNMAGTARLKYVGLCWATVALFAFYDVPDQPWRKPLTFLGDASYSVYLLHPFVILAMQTWLPAKVSPLLTFALGLAFTLLLAGIVYRWVEKPAMGLGKRLAAR